MIGTVGGTNPLPEALRHYQRELVDTLTRCKITSSVAAVSATEGATSRAHKVRQGLGAIRNVIVTRRRPVRNLQTWPSLGLLELPMWSSTRRHAVVLHDPIPLRRQIGYDRLSKSIANLPLPNRPTIIVHSQDALEAAKLLLPAFPVVHLPHPVLTDPTPSAKASRPIVLVAGQYKPERRVDLLGDIGAALDQRGLRGVVIGRGWPREINGWEVTARFVSEAELSQAIASATVVVLPYGRYFQSGIAIRALESFTAFVSPQTSFATELLGEKSPLIVSAPEGAAEYLAAIDAALHRGDVEKRFQEYQAHVDNCWQSFFARS